MEKLAALECTQAEAAAWFGCSISTIEDRLRQPEYREAWDRGRELGTLSMRRDIAKLRKKSAAMAIFEAKNRLGWTDTASVKVESHSTNETTVTIQTDTIAGKTIAEGLADIIEGALDGPGGNGTNGTDTDTALAVRPARSDA